MIIIGGGISGTAAAWELVREGHSVLLLEARTLAAMASGWTLGGVRQSGRDPAELPLARAAVGIWAELSAVLGADVGYRQRGNLRLARSDAEASGSDQFSVAWEIATAFIVVVSVEAAC